MQQRGKLRLIGVLVSASSLQQSHGLRVIMGYDFSSETDYRSKEHDMGKDYAQIANDVVTGVGLLRQGAPDTVKAFGSLSTTATATKALDTKTKELMALAIGIAIHCEGCVAYHTKMAHQHGATREEVVETVALAVYMGGGPAAVYGGDALRAYNQFSGT